MKGTSKSSSLFDNNPSLRALKDKTRAWLSQKQQQGYPKEPDTCDWVEDLLLRRLVRFQSHGTTTPEPDVTLWNAALRAMAKCSPYNDKGPERAQALFYQIPCPDSASLANVLHAWAKSSSKRGPEAAARAQELFDENISLANTVCSNICIPAWGQAGRPEQAEELLWRVLTKHQQQDASKNHPSIQPDHD